MASPISVALADEERLGQLLAAASSLPGVRRLHPFPRPAELESPLRVPSEGAGSGGGEGAGGVRSVEGGGGGEGGVGGGVAGGVTGPATDNATGVRKLRSLGFQAANVLMDPDALCHLAVDRLLPES